MFFLKHSKHQTFGSILFLFLIVFSLAAVPLPGTPIHAGVNESDIAPPYIVAILRGADPNPTNKGSVQFWIYFNENVTGVNAADFTLTTSGKILGATITKISGNDRFYRANVNTGTGNGDIRLDLKTTATIWDLEGNSILPGGFTAGEIYTVDKIVPEVYLYELKGLPGGKNIQDWGFYLMYITSLEIHFSEDMMNPEGNLYLEDVTNPYNYMLIQPGTDGYFDTLTCEDGRKKDDISLPTGPVTYKRHGGNGPFISEVVVNNGIPLSRGIYRLFICGTTTLQDQAGNPINDGKDDVVTFTVGDTSLLPATGFAPGKRTLISAQPADKIYTALGNIWLEIPSLDVKVPIVGVPGKANGWDTAWLNNQVGWLEGTAFPSWQGNSVLTAHVYGYDGKPGPFVNLKTLAYDQRVIIHIYGQSYIFAVRSSQQVYPQDTAYAFQHLEGNSYLTLITCQGYDAASNTYLYRRLVRLVLVDIQ